MLIVLRSRHLSLVMLLPKFYLFFCVGGRLLIVPLSCACARTPSVLAHKGVCGNEGAHKILVVSLACTSALLGASVMSIFCLQAARGSVFFFVTTTAALPRRPMTCDPCSRPLIGR